MIKRREFIINSIVAGVGISVFPREVFSKNVLPSAIQPFTGIIPVSIIYEVSDLVQSSKKMKPVIKRSLQASIHQDSDANYCLIASAIPVNREAIFQFARSFKDQEANDAFSRKKLAFTIGWMIMKAINDTYSNIHRLFSSQDEINEMNIYQSAHLIKMLMLSDAYDENDLKTLFNALLPRTLGRMHTLKPDTDNCKKWLKSMSHYRGNNQKNLELLSKLTVKPDQKKVYKYIEALNFYNKKELIEMRKLLTGNETLNYDTKSLYGNAINTSVRNLQSFSSFLEGRISEERFKSDLMSL